MKNHSEDSKKFNEDVEALQANYDQDVEAFEATIHREDHEWLDEYNMGIAMQAKVRAYAFKESGNVLDGLDALQFHLHSGIKLPTHLREWAAKALEYTLSSNGKISLDKAFGLVESVGQINAFTEKNKEQALKYSQWLMSVLIKHFGFSVSRAARLMHRHMQSDVFTFSGIVYEPETLRKNYSTKPHCDWNSDMLGWYLGTPRILGKLDNHIQKILNKYNDIEFL